MTSGEAAPIIAQHLSRLQARLRARTTESPEALLADLVPELVSGLAALLNRPDVDLLGQSYEADIGRPDFSVKDGSTQIGHVETKPPGAGADTRRFKGHDREQWRRFRKLPNLLYTDGTDFALYRSGEAVGPPLAIALDEGAVSVESDRVRALVELVADFLGWRAVAPRGLTELAQRLAPLCSLLRDAVRDQLERSDSEVARAAGEVHEALFAGRGRDEVADAFAQVCAYSMLLARSRGASRLRAGDIEDTLAHGHPVLGRVVRLLVDDRTEAELGWALDTVRALIEAVDFQSLEAKRGADTWLYFYETFLAQYDPRLRDQYGVYYTPAPVISAQVALLDEILRTRMDKLAGLAAEGVTVLDPGVGTGSYPLRVIQMAAERAAETQGAGAVGNVVGNLGQNVFAFEVLVGPYAVAHLRMSESIAREGGRVPDDGLRVFLTDTLENPYTEPLDFGRQLEPLVEERRRALRVKSKQDILVCVGNPPYERLSALDEQGAQKGGWVVHGEGGGSGAAPIFSTFLDPAREHTMFSHIASLYNLYVYFWRWALWKVFEAPNLDGASNGSPGIVSFISASSYLSGPGFIGMREHLRRICDEIWIIDLGGEGHGARREENVFAIQTPVAICIASRHGTTDSETPATVRYARFRGGRREKLDRLAELSSLSDLEWTTASSDWRDSLAPAGAAEWLHHPALVDLFPFQTPGTKVGRTWPVGVTERSVEARWERLATAPAAEKAQLFVDPRFGRRTTDRVRPSALPPPASGERVAEVDSGSPIPDRARYGYRSLDRQWILADARAINLPRPPLWWAHGDQQIYMASLLTGVIGEGPAATVSACIPDLHYFRGSFGGKDIISLYRDPEGTPNVASGALGALAAILGTPVTGEQLFAYTYALLGSRAYTERFWEDLENPGLRLPITRDATVFADAVELGRELLNLHTYGERLPSYGRGVNPGSARIDEPIGPSMPEAFDYEPETETLRVGGGAVSPVAPAVWEYEVSGLHVLRSWLRYRMREPAGRARSSTSPLDRIRPAEWTRALDTELLELLWVLERTIALEPRQATLLDAICAGETVGVDELPMPTSDERRAPAIPEFVEEEGQDEVEGDE